MSQATVWTWLQQLQVPLVGLAPAAFKFLSHQRLVSIRPQADHAVHGHTPLQLTKHLLKPLLRPLLLGCGLCFLNRLLKLLELLSESIGMLDVFLGRAGQFGVENLRSVGQVQRLVAQRARLLIETHSISQ